MHSKTSKPRRISQPSLWKEAQDCSEDILKSFAHDLASQFRRGSRVLLEGEMGAGKTTFARALIAALGVKQPPEGSPTFAIAHEYSGPFCDVIHIDLYRIKESVELDEAGIPEYFWSRDAIVICEWISKFPEFEKSVTNSGENWRIRIEISSQDRRHVKVERL